MIAYRRLLRSIWIRLCTQIRIFPRLRIGAEPEQLPAHLQSLQKSFPARIHQLILYISSNKEQVNESVRELTFAKRRYEHFLGDAVGRALRDCVPQAPTEYLDPPEHPGLGFRERSVQRRPHLPKRRSTTLSSKVNLPDATHLWAKYGAIWSRYF